MLALTVALVLSKPTYIHDLKVERDSDGNPLRTMVTVRQIGGKPVWTRRFTGRADTKWSPDNRAIAIYGDLGYLTTWVAGEKVKRTLFPCSKGSWEAPEEFERSARWSPDNQRILFMFPRAQGDMILQQAELIIFNPAMRSEQLLGYVNRAQWIGNRTVRYWGTTFDKSREEVQTIPFGPIDKQVK